MQNSIYTMPCNEWHYTLHPKCTAFMPIYRVTQLIRIVYLWFYYTNILVIIIELRWLWHWSIANNITPYAHMTTSSIELTHCHCHIVHYMDHAHSHTTSLSRNHNLICQFIFTPMHNCLPVEMGNGKKLKRKWHQLMNDMHFSISTPNENVWFRDECEFVRVNNFYGYDGLMMMMTMLITTIRSSVCCVSINEYFKRKSITIKRIPFGSLYKHVICGWLATTEAETHCTTRPTPNKHTKQ